VVKDRPILSAEYRLPLSAKTDHTAARSLCDSEATCLYFPQRQQLPRKPLMRQAMYSHEAFTVLDGCWFDAQAVFSSSKSFLEIHDSLVCCWFDAQAAFKSSRSLLEMRDALFCGSLDRTQVCKSSLMRFTASSNVEDSCDDALLFIVDCASTSIIDNIVPPITATTNAKQNFPHILMNYVIKCGQFAFSTNRF